MERSVSPFQSYLEKNNLDEIISLHREASQKIKENEYIGEGLIVPSINELRYSFEHFVKAVSSSKSENEVETELNNTKNHLLKCIYDATEISILYHLKEIKQFQEDYQSVPIGSVIPNYLNYLNIAEEAKKIIINNEFSITDKLQRSYEAQRQLEEAVSVIERARDELNKYLENQRSRKFRLILNSAVAIIASLSALIAVVIMK